LFLRTREIFEWEGRDIDAAVASNFGRVTGCPLVVTFQVAIEQKNDQQVRGRAMAAFNHQLLPQMTTLIK
jgi:hypothetical protein